MCMCMRISIYLGLIDWDKSHDKYSWCANSFSWPILWNSLTQRAIRLDDTKPPSTLTFSAQCIAYTVARSRFLYFTTSLARFGQTTRIFPGQVRSRPCKTLNSRVYAPLSRCNLKHVSMAAETLLLVASVYTKFLLQHRLWCLLYVGWEIEM
jgi:hypothetical protein